MSAGLTPPILRACPTSAGRICIMRATVSRPLHIHSKRRGHAHVLYGVHCAFTQNTMQDM